MPSDEFWYGEPRLAEAYRKAHELRMEITNQQLWMQGLYNTDALQTVIGNAFSKGPKKRYLEKPLPLKEEKQTPEQAKQKVVDQLNAWKEAWDKRREENGSIEHK